MRDKPIKPFRGKVPMANLVVDATGDYYEYSFNETGIVWIFLGSTFWKEGTPEPGINHKTINVKLNKKW